MRVWPMGLGVCFLNHPELAQRRKGVGPNLNGVLPSKMTKGEGPRSSVQLT